MIPPVTRSGIVLLCICFASCAPTQPRTQSHAQLGRIVVIDNYNTDVGTRSALFGSVFDEKSFVPLVAANIVIDDSLGGPADMNGTFSFRNVASGRHSIRVSAIGYAPFHSDSLATIVSKATVIQVFMSRGSTPKRPRDLSIK